MPTALSMELPAVAVCLGVLLASDPSSPCGPRSTRAAITVVDHVAAIVNHTYAALMLIAKRYGTNKQE